MLKPSTAAPKPSIDLLVQAPTMDNNHLEKLVKNFVDEDKARIAAARGGVRMASPLGGGATSPIGGGRVTPPLRSPVISPIGGGVVSPTGCGTTTMSSSIQYALQKFERRGSGDGDTASLTKVGVVAAKKVVYGGVGGGVTPIVENITQQSPKPAIGQKPQISPKPFQRLSANIGSGGGDTVEMTLPPDLAPTPTSPASSAGLQTWPLKNRVISTDAVKKTSQDAQKRNSLIIGGDVHNQKVIESQKSLSIDHQVALEEKKLINALKNGDVVNEEAPKAAGKGSSVITVNGRDSNREIAPVKPYQPTPVVRRFEPVSKSPSSCTTTTSITTTITVTTSAPSTPSVITTPSNVASKWGLRSTPRRPEQQVPHPELTANQRQHLRANAGAAMTGSSVNPVRPFLTRGSVAERVLIFERCPSDLLLDKRVRAPVQSYQVTKPQPIPKQPSLQHTTLQRHVRAHRNVNIPRFHFPVGKPGPPGQQDIIKTKVTAVFTKIGERASREHFAAITQACQLPLYWKTPLYLAACADKGSCTLEQFLNFWQGLTAQSHDAASRFIHILTRGRRTWLAPEDFIPLVQDVVETHPGLVFLKEATEFHSRYVHTVIARIYYCVNRSWSGKISIPELRRSNLLSVIQLLEEEEDINQITQYFSYEHFYVIYCKFWELDRDHDLFIDKQDLMRHNDHALSTRIIDRIFCGCVTRDHRKHPGEEKMSYTDFVWFLLSEEDKLHPTAIEYWFRCMDLDGDGYLSMYELEYFYEEQMQRMEAIGIETLPFQDCLCQMLDMVKPRTPGKISLSDLKKCKMTSIFFDTFFNLEKYLDHEQRDPFASQRDHDIDGQEMSDWDRYAAEEYELLVAEEGNDQGDSL
nr:unnamed protein product [Callosobruchus chinensis]